MKEINPPQHTDIIEWPFRSNRGESDPFDVLKDLREGFSEYEEQPWMETLRLSHLTDYSSNAISQPMMWLCGSWRLPESMAKCNGQPKRYINPVINHDHYADVRDDEIADWIRMGLRHGLPEESIQKRAGLSTLSSSVPEDDTRDGLQNEGHEEKSFKEWCGEVGITLERERHYAQMVLGRTFEHLLKGHHPVDHRDSPERSFGEIGDVWGLKEIDVKVIVQYYQRKDNLLPLTHRNGPDGTMEISI